MKKKTFFVYDFIYFLLSGNHITHIEFSKECTKVFKKAKLFKNISLRLNDVFVCGFLSNSDVKISEFDIFFGDSEDYRSHRFDHFPRFFDVAKLFYVKLYVRVFRHQ
jgi:hypothetical protein